jgi:hypothetical protein
VGYDPVSDGGDGVAHQAQIPNLYDGNPSTYWNTDHYYSPAFGGLKPGVGFVLELAHVDRLDKLTLVSNPANLGWKASIYRSRGPFGCSISSWGKAVSHGSATGATTTFSLKGAKGAEVLVWFTHLGPSAEVSIGEATLTGSKGSAGAPALVTSACQGSAPGPAPPQGMGTPQAQSAGQGAGAAPGMGNGHSSHARSHGKSHGHGHRPHGNSQG